MTLTPMSVNLFFKFATQGARKREREKERKREREERKREE